MSVATPSIGHAGPWYQTENRKPPVERMSLPLTIVRQIRFAAFFRFAFGSAALAMFAYRLPEFAEHAFSGQVSWVVATGGLGLSLALWFRTILPALFTEVSRLELHITEDTITSAEKPIIGAKITKTNKLSDFDGIVLSDPPNYDPFVKATRAVLLRHPDYSSTITLAKIPPDIDTHQVLFRWSSLLNVPILN